MRKTLWSFDYEFDANRFLAIWEINGTYRKDVQKWVVIKGKLDGRMFSSLVEMTIDDMIQYRSMRVTDKLYNYWYASRHHKDYLNASMEKMNNIVDKETLFLRITE